MFGAVFSKDPSTAAMTLGLQSQEMLSETPPTSMSDNSSNVSGSGDDGGSSSGNFDKYLWMYVSPLIFVIGVIGNILTIAVLRRRKFQGTTTAVYLPLLAAADTAALIFGIIPEWLDYCEIVVFKELHPWTCKFEKFLFYTSGDTAIWILVAFTFDRFIAVCFPFHKRAVCQPRRASIICGVIFALAVVKNLHVFWTRGPQYDEDGELYKVCGRPEPYTRFEVYVRPWIAFAVVMAVPFLIIIVCNTLIIRTLLKARRLRSQQTHSDKDKSFIQTTTMCMSASFAFLAFIAPSLVLLIGSPYWSNDDESNEAYNYAKAINNQLVYVNHSINFFLYCLTGAKFREELVALFQCINEGDSSLSYYNKAYKPKEHSRLNSQASGNTRTTDLGTNGSSVLGSPKICRNSPRRSPRMDRETRQTVTVT